MLLVQDYLRTKTLDELYLEHGVGYKISDHKVSLNYSITKTKNSDLLAQQCRGLILRTLEDPASVPIISTKPLGETKVLARPFDRFFNYGDEQAAEIDFSNLSTTFYEKVDGTLCLVYYDDILKEWHVATRSVPEANIPLLNNKECTFRTLFESAVNNTTGKEFSIWASNMLFRDTTYMFELTSPKNQVIIKYDTPEITLLGGRKTLSGKEISPAFLQAQVKVSAPERYRFKSIEELINFTSSRNPTKHEGIVICDNKFQRVKVKNAGYLAYKNISLDEGERTRSIVELILLGTIDDVIPFLPNKTAKLAETYKEKYKAILSNHKNTFKYCLKEAGTSGNKKGEAEHRKVFATSAQSQGAWLTPMMEQYTSKIRTLPEWIKVKRQRSGSWSSGFLDTVIKELQKL